MHTLSSYGSGKLGVIVFPCELPDRQGFTKTRLLEIKEPTLALRLRAKIGNNSLEWSLRG